jgi:hypothetical protein
MRTISSIVWSTWVANKIDWKHGLTTDDVEHVLRHPSSEGVTRRTGRPCRWGRTPSKEYVFVVFEWLDIEEVEVVSAYVVPEQ